MTYFDHRDVDAATVVERNASKGADGYYALTLGGISSITAEDLRAMATVLDEMNAEWDQIVKDAT